MISATTKFTLTATVAGSGESMTANGNSINESGSVAPAIYGGDSAQRRILCGAGPRRAARAILQDRNPASSPPPWLQQYATGRELREIAAFLQSLNFAALVAAGSDRNLRY